MLDVRDPAGLAVTNSGIMPHNAAMTNRTNLFDAEEILVGILRWVSIESPTYDPAAVNLIMDQASAELAALGARIERVPGTDGYGDVVKARLEFGDHAAAGGPGILVLGHLDTVHPVGTIGSTLPLRRDGDRQYGPGIFDMKGGLYLALHALQRLLATGARPRLPVTFLLIPDEEVGSPSTRALIEREAQASRCVLVPEPGRPGNKVVTGRHAFQRYFVSTHGRPAHAGANNRDGRSAIRVMARLIEEIEAMSDFDRGITYSVGVVQGGQWVNVIPIECRAQVLAVAPDEQAFEEVPRRMAALSGERNGVRVEIERGPVRPLFRAHPGTMALYEQAKAIADDLGLEFGHGQYGGGSDGNFTGALGIATLDGLGVLGAGAHTHEEHLLVSSLVPRAQVLAGLFERLR
jgi:glutamate carboxypeptidase